MKPIVLSILLFLSIFSVHAQIEWLGIINDPDGYTNVRADSSMLIIDKLYNNQVFFDWNTRSEIEDGVKDNWHHIEYGAKNGMTMIYSGTESKTGRVHKSRIRYLSELKQLPQISSSKNIFKYGNDTLNIEIKRRPFNAKSHKLVKDQENGWLKSIDGVESLWGIDGNIPQYEYESVTVTYPGGVLQFPKENLQYLYEPGDNFTHIALSDDNTFFLFMMNSDGAGGYMVVWTIKDYHIKSQLAIRGF